MQEETPARPCPAALAAHLRANETLLWHGQPYSGLIIRTGDWVRTPLLLLVTLILLMVLILLSGGGDDPTFSLTSIAIATCLTGLAIGPFFLDAEERIRTYYAITSQRILIITGLRRQHIRALDLHTLTDTPILARRSGRGNICLEPPLQMFRWKRKPELRRFFCSPLYLSGWHGVAYLPACLEAVTDPDKVCAIIHHARTVAHQTAGA